MKFSFIVSLIVLAAASRLLPHPPNFAPIAAIALFGGATFTRKRWAFILPLAAMFASDLVIGWLSGRSLFGLHETTPVVYLAFVATVCIGFTLKENRAIWRLATTSFISSLLFFVSTNFSVWTLGLYYPKTWEGLVTCFVAAIPFFPSTLLGDACYVGLMFGALALVERRFIPSPHKT